MRSLDARHTADALPWPSLVEALRDVLAGDTRA